jgi:hypothetical protein
MRTKVRITLVSVVALFWAGAALLALEFGVRIYQRDREGGGKAYWETLITHHAQADEAARQRLDPEAPPPEYAVFDSSEFIDKSESERAAFAAARDFAVVVTDNEGGILEYYPQGAAPDTLRALAPLQAGGRLQACLPEAMARDLSQTLQQTAASGMALRPHYTLTLPEGDTLPLDFNISPVLRNGAPTPRLVTYISPSIWEEVFLRYAPNVRSREQFIFNTNSQGWRDDPMAIPKPDNVVRIVCIGGSTTVRGLTNAMTYPNLLERMLREHFNTDRIEVVNCGVEVVDSMKETVLLDAYLENDPDLILHYNFVNDLPGLLMQWAGIDPSQGETWDDLPRFRLRSSELMYRLFNRRLLGTERALRHGIQQFTFAQRETLLNRLRAAGVELAVCSFAYPKVEDLDARAHALFDWRIHHQGWGWPKVITIDTYGYLVGLYNDLLKSWSKEHNIHYIPLAEEFHGDEKDFTDVCHLNAPAIEAKAAIIYRHIAPWVAQRLEDAETANTAS